MTKVNRTLAIVFLAVLALVACTGSAPTAAPTTPTAQAPAATPAPAVAPTAQAPTATPIAPAPTAVPTPAVAPTAQAPTATPAPAPTATPTPEPFSLKVDAETTWREVFEALTPAEQDCIRGGIDESELERAVAQLEEWEGDKAIFPCLAPETAHIILVDGHIALVESMDGSTDEDCVRAALADIDAASYITDTEVSDAAWPALFACNPDAYVDFFADSLSAEFGLDPQPTGEQRACLHDTIPELLSEDYSTIVAMFSCLPDLFAQLIVDGFREEGMELNPTEEQFECLSDAMAGEVDAIAADTEGTVVANIIFGCIPDLLAQALVDGFVDGFRERGMKLNPTGEQFECLSDSLAGEDAEAIFSDSEADAAVNIIYGCIPDLFAQAFLDGLRSAGMDANLTGDQHECLSGLQAGAGDFNNYPAADVFRCLSDTIMEGVVQGWPDVGEQELTCIRDWVDGMTEFSEITGLGFLTCLPGPPASADTATATPEPLPCDQVDEDDWVSGNFLADADAEKVALALQCGADVNARDSLGLTPLHLAVHLNDDPAVIQALLDGGADVNAVDGGDHTPLHLAAEQSDLLVILALLDAGADVNAESMDGGRTALHSAAAFNPNPAVIPALLDAGAYVNAKDGIGRTPLHDAAGRSDLLVVQALLEAGADVEAKDIDGRTPLDIATSVDANPAVLQALLDASAGAEAIDNAGTTPVPAALLCHQVHRGKWLSDDFWAEANAETVTEALKCGADVNAKDSESKTPLHIAAWFSDDPAVIQALLDAGANVNAEDDYGRTPLHEAGLGNENPAVIRTLLDAGAGINAKDVLGKIPLHNAAFGNQNPAVIQTLLDGGSDVNAKDDYGQTPLLSAVLGAIPAFIEGANREIIEVLLDAGADVNAETSDGDTPLDIAKRNENEWAIRLLEEAGAR